jgi:succinate dehydrogenase / fumarate reductase cytochrome b subunit
MPSLVKKYLIALTGLGLVGFLVLHLLGNLQLYLPDGSAFNLYAAKMHDLGIFLIIGEIGLLLVALVHVGLTIGVTAGNKSARPEKYQTGLKSKGGPSKSTFGSRNMIITGLVLFAFLVLHLWQFRFGPKMDQGYVAQVDGRQVWDLHRLVIEAYKNPVWVVVYVAAMLFMGLHVRHGFWSAFQSLGLAFPKYTKLIYALALVLALILTAGFLFIPVWIYFFY